ncbi:MAG: sensor domain-containing diguanylate cyclase [Steroidobacteraceae bacterium]|nr:sensor domain-containing diguanylate cyclase [Steroidobacteraceae bacterium]
MSPNKPDDPHRIKPERGATDEAHDALRQRFRNLLEQVTRNETLLQKTQARELELLRATSLSELFERTVNGLREAYALDSVTLNVLDPQHELRHMVAAEKCSPAVLAQVHFLESIARFAPQLETADRPWLGPYQREAHRGLLATKLRMGSVALIPLPREGRSIGVLAFASLDSRRFTRDLASDFLGHLGVIISICLENTVNRTRLTLSGVTDYLTGLYNRRYLQGRLREEVARAERQRGSVACLMIDVDHFKTINDRHGHLAGDAILTEIGRRIERSIRGSDTGARYGGDEFAVLLPGAGIAEAEILARRIHAAGGGAAVTLPDGTAVKLSLSIGVAAARPAAGDRDAHAVAERLVAAADAVLYRAKRAGRGRVECEPVTVT